MTTHRYVARNRSFLLSAGITLLLLMSPGSQTFAGFFDRAVSGFSSSSEDSFLPVEEAFRLEAHLKGTTLTLSWQIEPEHYLYLSRFSIKSVLPESATLQPIHLPEGERYHDEFQGDVEILRNHAELTYRYTGSAADLKQGMVVDVTFQGCADAGLCYPPHTQQLNLVPTP